MLISLVQPVLKRIPMKPRSNIGRVRMAKLAAIASSFVGGLIGYQAYGGARFEPHDWVLIGLLLAGTALLLTSEGEDDLADTVSSESG